MGTDVDADIQFDNKVPEKFSYFTFDREMEMNNLPKEANVSHAKLLQAVFDDFDSFMSMNQRLAKAQEFTIRIYNKHQVRDRDVRIPTSGLKEILPEFYRRCEESRQRKTR
ncbi:hypothetical protein [Thioalkalivibrio sp. HK1]|uniref:hypothetical protein n=1 Tax=Thioalkalivibrio sp. HK1 TaxID=1469245 RepID=UPI000472F4DC|nr:hypothetical protein [Thioalkalivibrio sp. HK1]